MQKARLKEDKRRGAVFVQGISTDGKKCKNVESKQYWQQESEGHVLDNIFEGFSR